MKTVAENFIKVYLNVYHLNLYDQKDQERLLKELTELELEDCLLFMEKYEIKKEQFLIFHKKILEAYQRLLKRLQKELIDNKRNDIDHLIDYTKWEQKNGKLDYWLQQLIQRKRQDKKFLTKKQVDEIRKLETKKRVMDYILPKKESSYEYTEFQPPIKETIKPKKRFSNKIKLAAFCASMCTIVTSIFGMQGYFRKFKDIKMASTVKTKDLEKDALARPLKELTTTLSKITLSKNNNEFEEDLEKLLNTIPAIHSNYTVKEHAQIHSDLSATNTNSDTPVYKAGTIKENSGYALVDSSGQQVIVTDSLMAYEMLKSEDYIYAGNRAINEYSYDELGNIKNYEGLFSQQDIVLIEGEKTLYEEIKEIERTRTLKK